MVQASGLTMNSLRKKGGEIPGSDMRLALHKHSCFDAHERDGLEEKDFQIDICCYH